MRPPLSCSFDTTGNGVKITVMDSEFVEDSESHIGDYRVALTHGQTLAILRRTTSLGDTLMLSSKA